LGGRANFSICFVKVGKCYKHQKFLMKGIDLGGRSCCDTASQFRTRQLKFPHVKWDMVC